MSPRRALAYLLSLLPVAVLVLVLLQPGAASAQMPYFDDLPFFTPADSTSRLALVADLNRFEETKFNWSVNRLLISIILPAGQEASFFIRMPLTTFDTGQTPLFSRWPWLAGEEADSWPDSRRYSGFGQPEIGATGPLGLSMLPNWHYGVALGLPAGTDFLYPFSSVSMPLRLEARKMVAWGTNRQLGLNLGYVMNMKSAKDYLNSDYAFPSGWHLGSDLNFYRGRGKRMSLAYDYHNRNGKNLQLIGVQGWLPWTDDGSVGLKVSREIQGTLDNPATWYFTLSFRLDSDRYRPAEEEDAP